MKHSRVSKVAAFALAGTLVLGGLAGCAAQPSPEEQQQTANRQYMAQVSQTMEDLSGRLASFADAVARGDAVSMRTQADSAYKALDSLESSEAPEALKDVQAAYVEGCAIMEEALDSYIALYGEKDALDEAVYAERLAAVQQRYDEGLAKLQEADELAAGKE